MKLGLSFPLGKLVDVMTKWGNPEEGRFIQVGLIAEKFATS